MNLARAKKFLDWRRDGDGSTALDANAAMKGIVRRDVGDDWKKDADGRGG